MAELEAVAGLLTDPRQQYFGKQALMQLGVVKGWLAAAEGRPDEAERLLREAAASDDALGKHPVSPGTLLPSRELLADFLLERGRFKDARVEYEACLKLNPRRFNSVYGAAKAAEGAGDREAARRHYGDLQAMVAPGSTRAEVAHARAFLAGDRRAAR
jgi:tetratricopeptide (TPR) repeat protein